ncbi:MAG: hypothetical protein ABH879_01310 [archaeon]
MTKPKVGFYGVTGCAGCLLSVAFNEDELLDILNAVDVVAFPLIKGENSIGRLDIVFLEGAIVSNDDLKAVTELRERSDVLVALGTCACLGNIPALRNFVHRSKLANLKYKKRDQIKDVDCPGPLAKYIKVDYSLPGCPPDRDEIKGFIKDILLGKEYRDCQDPVCSECRLSENGCLLDQKKICLGPLTRARCGAVCPVNGLECYGCRGFTNDANFQKYFSLLSEKGFPKKEVMARLDTFASVEIREKLK